MGRHRVRKSQPHGRRARRRRRSRSALPLSGRSRFGLLVVAAALVGAVATSALTSAFVAGNGGRSGDVVTGALDRFTVRLGESDAAGLVSPLPLLGFGRPIYPPWRLPTSSAYDPRSEAEASRIPARTAAPSPPPVIVTGRIQPPRLAVPRSASGRYAVVPGQTGAAGSGPVVRYLVEVERGLAFDPEEFAAEVHRILNHERGWGRAGVTRFVRVDHGPVRFRVSLSTPTLTDSQCLPLQTFGRVSCWNGLRSVINALRWAEGSPTYGGDVASYREYVISHEVGHALGHGHVGCPGPGWPAPVMVQQSKSLDGCAPNPWPYR